MASRDARPSIPEDLNAEMAENLENHGATEELLQLWTGHEDRLFEQMAKQSFTLSIQWRRAALGLANELTHQMKRPRSYFFSAVQLFDASSSRMVAVGSVPDMSGVFSWVAAAWLINIKISDEPSQYPVGLDDLATIASHHSSNCGGREIVPEDIQLAEAVLLSRSNFFFRTTTVETWVNAFAFRFDLVTGNRVLGPHLGALEAVCTCWTSLLTLLVPYSSTSTPRMSACGIFGLALLALRILPVQALNPAESTQAAGWATQVEQIIAFTQVQMDDGQLQLDLHSVMMPMHAMDEVIEFATMYKKADVQDRTVAVVRNLLEAAGILVPHVATGA